MQPIRKLRHHEIARRDPDAAHTAPRHPIVTVVDNVRSIYNVGSLFRSADALWIEHLYLTGITGTPDHRQLHKTALGAQDTVPWSHHRNAAALVERLRGDGYCIAALEITDRPTPLAHVRASDFPMCLVVGNEVEGVQAELVAACDLALEIPQYGTKQSFNVGVAYGIALYELVRTYRQHGAEARPIFPLPTGPATQRAGKDI